MSAEETLHSEQTHASAQMIRDILEENCLETVYAAPITHPSGIRPGRNDAARRGGTHLPGVPSRYLTTPASSRVNRRTKHGYKASLSARRVIGPRDTPAISIRHAA